jgi:predicted dehydrogenase
VLVQAARAGNRIVQHGTQGRSSASWARHADLVRSGRYGKLLVSRALCYKPRGSIGVKPDEPAPPEIDYNLWLGPAPETAFNTNYVHYNWHWFWPFGNGDIGNQGVHQFDIARWMVPDAGLPTSVFSLGGRFGYEDQGQTPNTQLAVLGYGEGKPMIVFEVRGLKTDGFHGEKVGNILHFEEGVVAGDRFYRDGKGAGEPLAVDGLAGTRGPGGGNHFANFVAAVRSRSVSDLNADILEGHLSSALCHLANASYRLGEPVPFSSSTQPFDSCAVTCETFDRMKQHLVDNGVPLDGLSFNRGRTLAIDPVAERFVNDPEADALLTRPYRAPFTVPDQVG